MTVSRVAPPGALQAPPLAEIQRARLIAGAIRAIDELGYADATVADITAQASVSRRTFYELFANREECLAAALEDATSAIATEVRAAGLDDLPWRERIRSGLAAILAFLDREPASARVCVVEALRGGPRVLALREQMLAELAALVDQGRAESPRGERCSALTAEGVVGAACAIVYARLLRGENRPLIELLGELTAIVVLPYLGPAAARREQRRPVAVPPALDDAPGVNGGSVAEDPLRGVRMRLTYRTSRVLECVAERPGASNRAVSEYAGVSDAGQISKLLARLERIGLLANSGEGHAKGEPNAWRLTAKGEQVARNIRRRVPTRRVA